MDIRISTASKGQLIGFSDVIFNRLHTTTLKCASCKGSLYSIKAVDFM